jgi:hypothetical protein
MKAPPLAFIFTGARSWRALITLPFFVLNLWVSWNISPKSY